MRVRSLNRNFRRAGNGVIPFSPRRLFGAGEQGAWYDPSDFSTLFQDPTGLITVTAVDQPVGLMRDKSGRGNHASQVTATSRPTLKQDASGKYYLLFDGIDDWLVTGNIDFTATDKMTVFAGLRKLSDTSLGVFCELSASTTVNNGSFVIFAPTSANVDRYSFQEKGSVGATAFKVGYAAPVTSILTCDGDISGDIVRLTVNATNSTTTMTDQGTGNYGSYPLYIGRRGGSSGAFNGGFYGLIVRGVVSTSAQKTSTEKWLATKTGVTL